MKAGLTVLGVWCATSMPALGLPVFSLSGFEAGGVAHVVVSASGATDLYGYQFSLNFNPALLHATTVSEGPFLASGGATFFSPGTTDNALGQVSFVFDTLLSAVAGVNGSGVLATIDFSVLSRASTTLSLSDVLAVDSVGNVLPTQTGQLSIPEPGMLALLPIALLALMLVMRRQRRT
jgi:hypothetical protein